MLGLRGTLSYTIDARLFEVELGALATLQQAGYRNLHLMLPFVRSVEEVIACRRYIELAGLCQVDGFALWMMAEVPSVLFLLPAYAKARGSGHCHWVKRPDPTVVSGRSRYSRQWRRLTMNVMRWCKWLWPI